MRAYDFTIAYWGVASLVWQLIGISKFLTHDNYFDWGLWVNGFFASFFNLIGCMFAICCFSTGAPIGPASALISTQTILVVIVASISAMTVPSAMQIIGLCCGLFGALLLTVPKELYALWYRLTRCRALPPPEATKVQGHDSSL